MSRTIKRILIAGPLAILAVGVIAVEIQAPLLFPSLAVLAGFAGWLTWAIMKISNREW